jgi:septal ring factor EnvC (AmiA/AmiB activator)
LPIIGLAMAPPFAWSADDDDLVAVEQILQTERVQKQALEQAAADLERDVDNLRLALIEAARRSHNHEARISALEVRLTELTRLEAEKREALARRKDDLAATLGALQRLSRQPPEALAATPATIDDSIRASLLLSTVVPLIDRAAKALGSDLKVLAALHREIATERLELGETRDSLAAERQRIDDLHQQKVALHQDTETQRDDARDQITRLAAEAKSLRDLLARLTPAPDHTPALAATLLPADEKPEAPAAVALLEVPDDVVAPAASRSIIKARGKLPMPARGRLVALFGDQSNGVRSKGISIETRDGAQVITPYDGEVVFAGPFRGYGQLLIIEHGEGYHTLLAGFSRIDSILGQWLQAGEPVGIMGWGSNGGPVLYVELRRDGVAINPLPWLAVSENKVSG